MYLPDPKSLGLSAKFPDWRPQQEEAILRLMESSKRFFVPVMPTGAGKGLFYVGFALLVNKGLPPPPTRVAFLTVTKGLQNQNLADFESAGLFDIRGQSNYECIHPKVHGLVNCDEGPCHFGIPCKYLDFGCLYYDRHRRAKEENLVQTNYSKWMHELEVKDNLGEFNVLVLDEGHDAFEALSKHLAVDLTPGDLKEAGEAKLPDYSDFDSWQKASVGWLGRVEERRKKMEADAHAAYQSMNYVDPALLGYIGKMKLLEMRLKRLVGARGKWIHQKRRQGNWGTWTAKFDPIWPASYAEEFLFNGIEKIVITSATVSRKTLKLLGVPEDQTEFIEFPATFPVERRPVYVVKAPRIDHKMTPEDREQQLMKIEAIIRPRLPLGWRAIIHAVSYERAQWILRNCKYNQYFLLHESHNLQATIDLFRTAKPPVILVSPSVSTGFDFPDDDCRYQIMMKIPFPDSRNIILKAREEMDKSYVPHVVCQIIEQTAGRSTRNPRDWSEVFIVDGHFGWFYRKYRMEFMHHWFQQAVSFVDVVPEPLSFGSTNLQKGDKYAAG